MNAFLSFDAHGVRCLPVSVFVKVGRAGITLLRLWCTEPRDTGPTYTAIRTLLDEQYIERIVTLLTVAVDHKGTFKAAKSFADLFSLLASVTYHNLRYLCRKTQRQFDDFIARQLALGNNPGAVGLEVVRFLFRDEQSAFMRDEVFFRAVEIAELAVGGGG